ncbi:hypothetical protein EDB80DRAFT_685625 [Ilyonectria destructans]|nr:hypothetical protein EDB80DRAFT_685625 [Ilyonectria destructans]
MASPWHSLASPCLSLASPWGIWGPLGFLKGVPKRGFSATPHPDVTSRCGRYYVARGVGQVADCILALHFISTSNAIAEELPLEKLGIAPVCASRMLHLQPTNNQQGTN